MRNGTNVEKLKPTVVRNRMQHNITTDRKQNNRNAYGFFGTGLIEGKID